MVSSIIIILPYFLLCLTCLELGQFPVEIVYMFTKLIICHASVILFLPQYVSDACRYFSSVPILASCVLNIVTYKMPVPSVT